MRHLTTSFRLLMMTLRLLQTAPSVKPVYARVIMPDDIADRLERNGLRAKRPETRAKRIAQMLGELAKGDLYMAMSWSGPAKR